MAVGRLTHELESTLENSSWQYMNLFLVDVCALVLVATEDGGGCWENSSISCLLNQTDHYISLLHV